VRYLVDVDNHTPSPRTKGSDQEAVGSTDLVCSA
jgi:hypothetical protein